MRNAAMPTVCCRSIIIIRLIFSLKSLGRMDELKHLMSPTLGAGLVLASLGLDPSFAPLSFC